MATRNHNLSKFDSPLPSAADMRFGIVVAEWNREVTEALLEGAVRTLRAAGCPDMNIQIAFGVLTVNDMQQALDRCGGRHGNKGDEAAATAINMVKLQIDMEAASPDHEPDRRNIN